MWATACAFFSRLWSLPMRAPPVRSYIHIALPSARATFGLMRPSFENSGMRNGSSRTRCGALRAQALALAERLVHEADVAVLQVAQAAVDELRALRRRAAGEVVPLDERGAQPAAGGIEGHPGAGDAAADHEHVERLGAQLLQRRGAVERTLRHQVNRSRRPRRSSRRPSARWRRAPAPPWCGRTPTGAGWCRDGRRGRRRCGQPRPSGAAPRRSPRRPGTGTRRWPRRRRYRPPPGSADRSSDP